jgi:hypothetical protein
MSDYLKYLTEIASHDVSVLLEKERTYQGSWKKRGGIGAYMMLARKIDRLENIMQGNAYDIFAAIAADASGADGSVLAEVRDLRRYLLLVEAEMLSRDEDDLFRAGTPEDGGHHARQQEETTAEHIARDIREGRFPQKSEPQDPTER